MIANAQVILLTNAHYLRVNPVHDRENTT